MGDTGIFPQFSLKSVQHKASSEKEGRPIFRDVEWLDIHIAGDKNTQVSRKVTDFDKQRFSAEYNAFKRGQEAPVEGTPLQEWALLRPAQVSELLAMRFRSVEDVAGMPDTAVQKIGMGGRELKKKAQAWLDSASNGAVSQKLVAENERQASEIGMLKEQLQAMNATIDELKASLEDKPKPKRKRRTKEQIAADEAGEVKSSLAS